MESLEELLLAFFPEFLAVLIAIPAGLWADRKMRSWAEASEQRESQLRAAKHLGIIREEVHHNLKALEANEAERARQGRLEPEFSLHSEGWLVVREAGLLADYVDVELMRDLAHYYNILTDAARLRDLVHKITLAPAEEMPRTTEILVYQRLDESLRTSLRGSESLVEAIDAETSRLASLAPKRSSFKGGIFFRER